MGTVEERVSYLEAKMEGVEKSLVRIEGLIMALDQKMDRRFDGVDLKFAQVNRFLFTILIVIIAGLFGIITRAA